MELSVDLFFRPVELGRENTLFNLKRIAMNEVQLLKRLCKSILQGRFSDEKYRNRKKWYGVEMQTQPLFCSYGRIGFSATVYFDDGTITVCYDQDLDELTIDNKPWKQILNTMILEDNGIYPISQYKDGTFELETYTDAGEDMIINLDKLDKQQMEEYIDNFDIDEEVMLWWQYGKEAAKAKGVPFDNIVEHCRDYQVYLKNLRSVSRRMF